MRMVPYILERMLHAIPVLLGVTIFVFLAVKFVPGDPIRIMTHGRMNDQEVEAIYHKLGMDRPWIVQYVDFVAGAAVGDLGQSIIQNQPVSRLVAEKVWPTLSLLLTERHCICPHRAAARPHR